MPYQVKAKSSTKEVETMTTWGSLREQVRRTVLGDLTQDEDSEYIWDDMTLRDLCWWALDTFADHTAAATSVTYTPGDEIEYDLPDNLYNGEILDLTGLVFFEDTEGDKTYLDPVKYTEGLDEHYSEGFYTFPDNVLHIVLDTAPDFAYLHVRYYAYYTHPEKSDDVIGTPQWANAALCYLIGAHALSSAALKSSRIRQWGAKPDTGNPEDNPILKQQQWFMEMYEKELSRYAPQGRINYHRETRRAN